MTTIFTGFGGMAEGWSAFSDVRVRLSSALPANPNLLASYDPAFDALGPTAFASDVVSRLALAARAAASGLGVQLADGNGNGPGGDSDENPEIQGEDRLLILTGDRYISGGKFDVSFLYGNEGDQPPFGLNQNNEPEQGRYRLVTVENGVIVGSTEWMTFEATNDERFISNGDNIGPGQFFIDLPHSAAAYNGIEFSGAENEDGSARFNEQNDINDFLLTGLKLSVFDQLMNEGDSAEDWTDFTVFTWLDSAGDLISAGANLNATHTEQFDADPATPTASVVVDLLDDVFASNPANREAAAGLGAQLDDGPDDRTGGNVDTNPEIQGRDSVIFVASEYRQIKAGSFDLSLFYAEEGDQPPFEPGTPAQAEQARYRLLHVDVDGNVVATGDWVTVTADGTGAFDGANNPGRQSFDIEINPNDPHAKFYNAIEFSGVLNADGTARANERGDVNDFLVSKLTFDVLDQVRGAGEAASGWGEFQVFTRLGAGGVAPTNNLASYNPQFNGADDPLNAADGPTALATDVLNRMTMEARAEAGGLGAHDAEGGGVFQDRDRAGNPEIQGDDRLLFLTDGEIKGGWFETSLFYEDDRNLAGDVDQERGRYRLVQIDENGNIVDYSDWEEFAASNAPGDTNWTRGTQPGLDRFSIDSELVKQRAFNAIEFSGAVNADGTAAGSGSGRSFDAFDYLISELSLNIVRDSEDIFADHQGPIGPAGGGGALESNLEFLSASDSLFV